MTARKGNTNPPAAAQAIPTFLIDSALVDDAYRAMAALQKAARDDTSLLENEYFKALQDTAYARFLAVFEAL